jgi:hypothetical protein|tara:strand:+ start:1899 stop:2279 length:381 start_codon:yes stop_codon:yes gene_type:complete
MNKLPDNVIQFPVMERVKQVINEKIDNEIERYETEQDIKEECVELAHYCFQLMNDAVVGNQFVSGYEDFDALDINKPEMKDMSAVINMLAATFYRYKGLEHPFQEELDNANDKLNKLLLECEDDFD